MILIYGSKTRGDVTHRGVSVLDKNGKSIFEDHLEVPKRDGVLENNLNTLAWALERAKPFLLRLEEKVKVLQVKVVSSNVMKYIGSDVVAAKHIQKHKQALDLAVDFYPLDLEFEYTREYLNKINYEGKPEDIEKQSENGLAFLESLG